MPQTFNIETFLQETTHAIWDAKEVGRIYETYTHNAQIRVSGQWIYGRESWITHVLQWQTMFPDLCLFLEDMIWQQDDKGGFRTSMRCVLVGTHLGAGRLGTPTGKRIAHTLMIHQQIWEKRIVEEYREENEIGLLNQLGLSEFPSNEWMLSESSQEATLQSLGEIDRLPEQKPPQQMASSQGSRFDVEHFMRQATHELWNERQVGKTQKYCIEHFRGHGSSRGELYGSKDLQKEILAFLAAFPDLCYQLDDIFWMGNYRDGFRVATRWTLLGTHEGAGRFGLPTGKRIQITGISHHHIHRRCFIEEWTEYSENLLYRVLNLPFQQAEPVPQPPSQLSDTQ